MTHFSSPDNKHKTRFAIGRTILIGFFTVAPLWVTWLVFDFLLGILASMGTPLLRAAAHMVMPFSETLATWLLDSDFQKLVAVLLTLCALYGIGVFASLVLGKKLLEAFEAMLGRLPLVQTIYGGTKRFLQTLRKPPATGQRVVLISFPTPEMKAVGFVTKVMKDADSGRELAAVYVPTSPNPTSGYIEIVPLDDVVQTDWTMEEAMSFVMTGGANAPEHIRFTRPTDPAT
ncbi:MAG: DUF502 domain-containing protein [Rhodocyclaceae bacterium]|nr:DUF502 domain-containing protein [Rhodocyclaceae bacterium]MDZ4215410.1 DUF502 domain-containing protein [Rhodocyclaceae bacterium]